MIVQTLIGSGAEPTPLTPLEIGVRGLVVFGFALLTVRLVARRFVSGAAPFDVILGVMLGAILSRIMIGPSPLIATMACVILLVLVHQLAGRASSRYRSLGDFLLGRPVALAQDGDREAKTLKRNHMSDAAFDRVPRSGSGVADLKDASFVTLQPSGHVSVSPRR